MYRSAFLAEGGVLVGVGGGLTRRRSRWGFGERDWVENFFFWMEGLCIEG